TGCDVISGWAWDATKPESEVTVDVYDGDKPVGTIAADQSRDHGKANHGFVYETPAQIHDGRPHSISVRISGTNIALRHTPQMVTCPESGMPAPPPGEQDEGIERH